MPDYEIYYFSPQGHLIHTLSAACNDDTAARVVAHAMRPLKSGLLEVRKDGALIYKRSRPALVAFDGTGETEVVRNAETDNGGSQ